MKHPSEMTNEELDEVVFAELSMPDPESFPYSADIYFAWKVMDWLRDLDCDVALESCGAQWRLNSNLVQVTALTAPRAICEAAVLVARAKKERR